MKQIRGPIGQPVLLVEDEARLREMLVRAMREMGFQPTGVASAEQAQRLLERQPFPVLIVDLNLPGQSGLDLLKHVRQHYPLSQGIILTGFGDLDAARRAIHLDVVDFLTKPCALGDLEIALGRAFQRLLQAQSPLVGPSLPSPEELRPGEDEESGEDDEASPAAADGYGDGSNNGPHEPNRRRRGLEFPPREGSEALSMEAVERQTIMAILERHGGNRAATASELGISIRKLYYRLAQYQKQAAASE